MDHRCFQRLSRIYDEVRKPSRAESVLATKYLTFGRICLVEFPGLGTITQIRICRDCLSMCFPFFWCCRRIQARIRNCVFRIPYLICLYSFPLMLLERYEHLRRWDEPVSSSLHTRVREALEWYKSKANPLWKAWFCTRSTLSGCWSLSTPHTLYKRLGARNLKHRSSLRVTHMDVGSISEPFGCTLFIQVPFDLIPSHCLSLIYKCFLSILWLWINLFNSNSCPVPHICPHPWLPFLLSVGAIHQIMHVLATVKPLVFPVWFDRPWYHHIVFFLLITYRP